MDGDAHPNYILISSLEEEKPLGTLEENSSENEIVKGVVSSLLGEILFHESRSSSNPLIEIVEQEKVMMTSDEQLVPTTPIKGHSEVLESIIQNKETSTETSDLIEVRDNWTIPFNPVYVDFSANAKPETREISSNTSPPHSYDFLVGRSDSVVRLWSEDSFPYYQSSSNPLRILTDEDEQLFYEDKTVEEIPIKPPEQIVPVDNNVIQGMNSKQISQGTAGIPQKKTKREVNSKKISKGLKNTKLYDPEFYWENENGGGTDKENSPEQLVPSVDTSMKRKLPIRTGLSKRNLKPLHPTFNPEDLVSQDDQDD